MEKIALGMIVLGTPDEAENLDRALFSVSPHVDKIFITFTGVKGQLNACENIARKYKAEISYGRFTHKVTEDEVKWCEKFFGWTPHMKAGDEIFLFDNARNFNFSQISQDEYQWILWMDTDDILHGGEKLHEIADIGRQANIEAFYFEYLYQVELDKDKKIKHVIIKHLRERLVRNIGIYKWIAPIHETLIEQRPSRKTDNYDAVIIHLATQSDRLNSLTRNLKNLEYTIYKSKGEDPRHVYYLAKAFYDLNTKDYDDKLIPLVLNHYILGDHKSGWPEERAQAFEYLSDVFKRRGENDKAIKSCMNALIESPDNPSIYLNIASAYMNKQDWERALFWTRIATSIPEKKTTLVVNPKDIKARTLEIIYNCSLNMSKIDEAWAAMVKLIELFPDDDSIKNASMFIQNLRTQRDLTRNLMSIADYLKQTGERGKIKALLAAAPRLIEQNPFVVNLFQQNNPPHPWEKDEVAIYCGQGFTTWGPGKLKNPKDSFVGGSEEAVIFLSKYLAKLGWKVTVYNDCGEDEGIHDGVKYLPYYKFNRLDNFNILIGWRDVRFFDTKFNAKKTYLWAHDILNPLEFTKERLDRITKVITLSKWHRDNINAVADDKVMISSNGLEI